MRKTFDEFDDMNIFENILKILFRLWYGQQTGGTQVVIWKTRY